MPKVLFSVDEKAYGMYETRGINFMLCLDTLLNDIISKHGMSAKKIGVDILFDA